MCRIAVIGCGVIGLSTALEIQNEIKGAKITVFTEKLSPNTTGDVSAGLWEPYLLENTPIEDVIKWSKPTLDHIFKLWNEGHAREAGISLLPIINLTEENITEPPAWTKITLGFHVLSDSYLKKLSKEHGKTYRYGYSFMTFTLEPTKYLPMLQKAFLENGGRIVMRKIENFEELHGYDVIVNCTGLYSKILNDDEKVQPVRGQVARVSAPWLFHAIMDNCDDGNYIIPNSECVILGGTHQNEDDLVVRKGDRDFILNGCYKIIPALKNATIINHQVGLRPCRDQVKIELEMKRFGSKTLMVVHNYGHGGSGVTLSYGSARDACDLVKKGLNMRKNKL